MTTDTPTPYQPPDGVILTTMGEARRIGHGQAIVPTFDDLDDRWRKIGGLNSWSKSNIVWWRPTPERTVTIELPESVARRVSTHGVRGNEASVVLAATRNALAALDGES